MTRPNAWPGMVAVHAKLVADLPDTYGVFDGKGPDDPQSAVPYVIVYPTPAVSDGAPFAPGRSLTGMFSVRAVGETAEQASKAADRVGAALDCVNVDAGDGRGTYVWQDGAGPMSRDDTAGLPALFEQLLIFGFRSDP